MAIDDLPPSVAHRDAPAEGSGQARSGGARAGRHYRPRPQARARDLRRWPRRVLVTCNVLAALLVVGACAVGGYAYYELHRIKRVHVAGLTPQSKGAQAKAAPHIPAFTTLIIGSDTRNLKKSTGLNIGNATTNAENLGDVIVLARVAPSTHQIALLSIPRDLFVNVPGLGQQKINAAFAGGDPSRLIDVIHHQLGIEVNHYVEVNFDSFEQIANALGGVEQYFPSPARDPYSDLNVPHAGCVLLKGAQALAFVRSRHYHAYVGGQWVLQTSPESDLGRIQRQQAFIKNAIAKVKRNGDLTNIGFLTSVINDVTSNLTVDSGLSDTELLTLAEDFAHVHVGGIPNITYPTLNIPVPAGQFSPGLERVPAADAAAVAEFLAVGHKASTKKAPHPAPSPTTTVPHGSISVEVENGSGTAGQATTVASALTGAGYTVAGTGNAANFNYANTTIEYGPSGAAAARTLEGQLASGATLSSSSSLTGDNLVLITGADYKGLGTARSGSAPTSTTTTTVPGAALGTPYASATQIEPYSSSYYHGIYIPPGRVPGQQIPTCGN